jgi:hypothetical protein
MYAQISVRNSAQISWKSDEKSMLAFKLFRSLKHPAGRVCRARSQAEAFTAATRKVCNPRFGLTFGRPPWIFPHKYALVET